MGSFEVANFGYLSKKNFRLTEEEFALSLKKLKKSLKPYCYLKLKYPFQTVNGMESLFFIGALTDSITFFRK